MGCLFVGLLIGFAAGAYGWLGLGVAVLFWLVIYAAMVCGALVAQDR